MSGNPTGLRQPLDLFPYPQDPRSKPADASLSNGLYAYVQDEFGIVFAVPDGPHIHPKVLGGARPALYAGDMNIRGGTIIDLTNLSGTFQFDGETGLLAVAIQLERQGLAFAVGAVRLFPASGDPPRVLR